MLNSVEIARRRDPSICSYCGWGMVGHGRKWRCVNDKCLKPVRTEAAPIEPMTFDH